MTTPSASRAPTILVVEDHDLVRELLADLLRSAGYEVATAANGKEALALLRAPEGASGPPCIILLDLVMPVLDGWEFLRRKAADPELAAIPVAVMSGVEEALPAAVPSGVVGHLSKPADLGALVELVAPYCRGG